MLIVETIGRIRREHFVKGKSIKEISRELRLSRNTVRKVLRSGVTAFDYQREVQPRPKLGRWAKDLERLLTSNGEKPARERLTLIRIFETLRDLGYEGGYDAVRRYAKTWRRAWRFGSVSYDWHGRLQSHEIVLLDGVTTTVKVAHVRFCHSSMFFVRAYSSCSGIRCCRWRRFRLHSGGARN